MGCTIDCINVTLKNRSYLDNFLKEFYEFLKDYFYDKNYKIHPNCIFSASPISECYIDIGEEPLFKMDENGGQVDAFIREYVKKYSDVDISMFYSNEKLNCDGAIHIEYIYDSKNKELTITRKYADNMCISYCPECEEYFDETLVYLDKYDENANYYCPKCGEELFLEVETTIEVKKLEEL